MPFEKNDKNINTKGRAKGVPNKTTSEIKTLLLSVFNDNLNEILSRQGELTLNERLALNKTLLPYIIPNVKQESFNNNLEPSIFDTSNW
jgi:hypothetical protein